MIASLMRQPARLHLSMSGPAVAEAVICCKYLLKHRSYNTPMKMGYLGGMYECTSRQGITQLEVLAGNRSYTVDAS
jgi:hypothetical protein